MVPYKVELSRFAIFRKVCLFLHTKRNLFQLLTVSPKKAAGSIGVMEVAFVGRIGPICTDGLPKVNNGRKNDRKKPSDLQEVSTCRPKGKKKRHELHGEFDFNYPCIAWSCCRWLSSIIIIVVNTKETMNKD